MRAFFILQAVNFKNQLKAYLDRYVRFSNEEVDVIFGKMLIQYLEPKEYLLQNGYICRHYYFIVEGLVRNFYIDTNGKERITQFSIENWWVTDMESFVRQQASHINIQAIEKTTVLKLSHTDIEGLCNEIPKLDRFFRYLTQNMLIALQRRNEYYLKMKREDLYVEMMGNLPDFIQRVPQYMLASYLDVTPEYLSEVRKKISLKNRS